MRRAGGPWWRRVVNDWLHPTVPAARVAALRILIGGFATGYLVVRAPHFGSLVELPASHWHPVGVAHLVPGRPVAAAVIWVGVLAAIASGVAFTAGWRHRFNAPVFAALLLVLTSYRNSFGQVFHTENLMVLHVAVLALSPAAAATASVDSRRTGRRVLDVDGWTVRLMGLVTVATYLLAGITKLRNAGWSWADGRGLRNYVAYDNLRKIEFGDIHSPLGGWLVQHEWLFGPIAVATLAVELGAPLALLGTRAARVWCASAWVFHVGVVAVMMIVFPYPLVGLAFAPLLAPERWPGIERVVAGAGLRPGIRLRARGRPGAGRAPDGLVGAPPPR